MTYFPQTEMPIWIWVSSTLLSYLFVVSVYSILFLGILNMSNLLEFNILYYVGTIIVMILSLYGIVYIQSKTEPEGW